MRRIRLLVVAALAASSIAITATPAQARCLPEYALICRVYVLICDLTGRPCAA